MNKVRIRKGDVVEVISGPRQERGKRGEVIKVSPKARRVTIQSVNVHKKHQRQYQTQGRTLQAGIIEFEMPMDISNVMVVCPSCDEASRLGIQREDGEVKRICKRCGGPIDK